LAFDGLSIAMVKYMTITRLGRQIIVLALAFFLVATSACAKGPGQAAIASADPLATSAGLEILKKGGNAFDAAVAVASTLGVVEPAGSGLGGGGFFLLYLAKDKEYRFIDAREKAPAKATRDMYLDGAGEPVARISMDGPLAAGIPGTPAGIAYLSEQLGELSLDEALQPAIRHAEDGYKIGKRALLGLNFRKKTLLNSPAFAKIFYPDGDVPKEGSLIVQTDLAATLRRLGADGADGADGFYKGKTAELLIDGVTEAGGIWTKADLADYSVTEREPIFIDYGDMRIVSAPPPSSGGIAMTQILNFLDGYDLNTQDESQRAHYLIEAMRRAYRDRAIYLGDPDFAEMPLEMLTSSDYMAGQRVSVRADKATPSANLAGIGGDGSEGSQTTHFSVIDEDGNRVAGTITVNTWYGSGFVPPGSGVLLNNEMDDFSVKPGVPNGFNLVGDESNAIEPGKRPLSSMSPSFLESDRGVAVVGTPGGSRIITMVLLAALDWQQGASAEEMVSMKRFHHQYLPDVVNYEPGAFSPETIAELEGKGHKLSESKRPFGNMNVVTWDFATDKVESATDPRGEGEGRVY